MSSSFCPASSGESVIDRKLSAPIVPDHGEPFGNKLIAYIAPIHRHPAKRAPISILALAQQLRWLLEDDAQAIPGGISGRWLASLAPRATGKLGGVDRARRGNEADLRVIAGAEGVAVVDRHDAQGEGFNHRDANASGLGKNNASPQ